MSETVATPPEIPTRPEVPAWKLVLTLGIAGALAGLLLVFVDQATREQIAENRRKAVREAVGEVLGGPAKVVSFAVGADALVREAEPNYEVDTVALNRVFAGYADEEGKQLLGFALAYQRTGFQDAIRVIFGYDPRTKKVLGVKVLEHKETPGLGDAIEKEPFLGPIRGQVVDLVPVKPGDGTGTEHEVDTITGATISSQWVVWIINEAVAKAGPRIDAWLAQAEGGR
ncbi:MAG: FMN-binding protein [Planctomycetota bacterium]|nr:FMN-binding protein [Planctomycetota bacterium]